MPVIVNAGTRNNELPTNRTEGGVMKTAPTMCKEEIDTFVREYQWIKEEFGEHFANLYAEAVNEFFTEVF